MKEPVIHIVLNMDDNYMVHTITMLTSLFFNDPDSQFTIHVLSSGLSSKVKKTLKNWIEHQCRQQVFFYNLNKNNTKIFPEYVNSHISQAANYRLFVADVLPADVHKIIYLDCDLIVEQQLSKLFNYDIGRYPIAAVEDMWSGKDDNYERLGYDRKYGYFNSGVLLINLDMWREKSLSRVFINYLNSHDNLKFIDQDILNGTLYDKWFHLPLRWNVQDGFLRCNPKIRKEKINDVIEECHRPAIIHFTGSRKPWNYDCLNPLKNRYFHYLDMNPWKGRRPMMPDNFKRKLMFDKILYALFLKPHKYRQDIVC